MPNYFYDTEFIERGAAFPIDLISIAIVCEDGREYYAISAEFNPEVAGDWVKENVLIHLPAMSVAPMLYKSRLEIAADIRRFMDRAEFGKPALWAYFGAYDHVALCQLYGTMANLPEGMPMYTRDIKQWADMLGNPELPPKPKDAHHALEDARWTMHAHGFLAKFAMGAL